LAFDLNIGTYTRLKTCSSQGRKQTFFWYCQISLNTVYVTLTYKNHHSENYC
jgi:hypothetical protein